MDNVSKIPLMVPVMFILIGFAGIGFVLFIEWLWYKLKRLFRYFRRS